jgi:DNA polymerase III sliding clamp (beta) subunit (PCNA family)
MYLSVKDSTLTLTAHNDVQEASATLDSAESEDGSLLIEARRFHNLLRAFSSTKPGEAIIKLELPAEKMLRITCGESKLRMVTLPADGWSFFTPVSREWLSIGSENFCSSLALCAPATRDDNATEPALKGVNLRCDGGGKFDVTACDGRYLIACVHGVSEDTPGGDVVLPDEAVSGILRAFQSSSVLAVTVDEEGALLSISSDDGTVVKSRLLAASYPNWQATLTQAEGMCSGRLTTSTADVLIALQRLRPALTKVVRTCMVALKGDELSLVTYALDVGPAREVVPATVMDAVELRHYVNVDFLGNIIKACSLQGEQVQVRWGARNNPLLIEPVVDGESATTVRCMTMTMQPGKNDPLYKEVLEWE